MQFSFIHAFNIQFLCLRLSISIDLGLCIERITLGQSLRAYESERQGHHWPLFSASSPQTLGLLFLVPASKVLALCLIAVENSFHFLCCLSVFEPGSHITVMLPAVPAVVSSAEYDYGTCVLSQLPQAEFNLV